MAISEDHIRDLAGDIIYSRGRRYFLSGRVRGFYLKDGILFGKIQGSAPNPYTAKIYFNRKDLHPECSCPYTWGDFCKHTVALALAWLQRNEPLPKEAEHPPDEEEETFPMFLKGERKQEQSSLFEAFYGRLTYEKPKLQVCITNFGLMGFAQEIKIKLKVIQGDRIAELRNLNALFSVNYYGYRDPNTPSLNEFTPLQQYCLSLLHSFDENNYSYSGSGIALKHIQFSVLLNEMDDKEIELVDATKKRPIAVCRDKIISLRFILGLTKKNKLRVKANLCDSLDAQRQLFGFQFIEGRPIWYFDEQAFCFYPLNKQITRNILFAFLDKESIVDTNQMPHFLASVLADLKDSCDIVYEDERLKGIKIEAASPKAQAYIDYVNKKLSLELKFIYPQRVITLQEVFSLGDFYVAENNSALHWHKRDTGKERDIISCLMSECRFQWNNNGYLYLLAQDLIFEFLYTKLPALQEKCEVFYSERLKKIYKSGIEFSPFIDASTEGINWFHFDVKYRAKGIAAEFSHEDIRRQLLKGKGYVRLKSGEFIPISKQEFDKIEGMMDEYDDASGNLPAFHIPFFIEEIKQNNIQAELNGSLLKLYEELKSFRSLEEVSLPSCLRHTLRDYQKKGIEWLAFLRKFNFGGILADEMGLGKTLQALTLIQKEIENGVKEPSLVICPTTLVWNWEAEIRKFVPDLKPLILQGEDRRKDMVRIKKADVVITSYAILRRDAQLYKDFNFHYVILDEAQNIKNQRTLNARVSKQLKAKFRLALTGTPLENSIMDLWSIFDFLMPSFLGRYERFKNRYEMPILKRQDSSKLKVLSRKIQPFILRRLKQQVIKELPDKIEQVSLCDLEPTQRRVYEEMLRLAKQEVLDAYHKQGFQKSQMIILTVLLRLRQICCHPELAGVRLGHIMGVSGKFNMLKELLQEALSGNHKILVFSQFVEMLKIIREYLIKEKIAFEYMDGSTKDREAPVNSFNNDEKIRLFLLSLKVGGLGLNLTSADTVILYEPWWNPAVENQAIDRAHRIGQKKTVVAYKMITKGTIEEKILELQKRKKRLIDSLVVSEEGIAKKLGWEDIKFLLGINE
jgi:SNF2 family DNA or RNA helicase